MCVEYIMSLEIDANLKEVNSTLPASIVAMTIRMMPPTGHGYARVASAPVAYAFRPGASCRSLLAVPV